MIFFYIYLSILAQEPIISFFILWYAQAYVLFIYFLLNIGHCEYLTYHPFFVVFKSESVCCVTHFN